jgi:hypothetical protein
MWTKCVVTLKAYFPLCTWGHSFRYWLPLTCIMNHSMIILISTNISSFKNKTWAGGMDQVVEWLPSMFKAPDSISRSAKKKKGFGFTPVYSIITVSISSLPVLLNAHKAFFQIHCSSKIALSGSPTTFTC